jgi:PAB-dependent poly(A)-specific ribonuclease subunit 2
MPKYYRKVDIKYSKFGIEDFDFGLAENEWKSTCDINILFSFYNRTDFGGLESHMPNTYVNSVLQNLYFTPLFKDFATWHIRTECTKEYCLYCELGFLFSKHP